VNWEGDEENLTLKESEYDAIRRSGITAHLEIDLPSKMEGPLVTAVYDLNSGKAGTLEIRCASLSLPQRQLPLNPENH